MIINNENLFLIILGIIWIIGAILQDLKRREVDNIWNFSLIAFALGYRAIVSIHSNNYWFILNGLIGLGIFLVLGNLFYYCRVFAGGDAKLVIALGTILPLSYNWIANLKIFGIFIFLFFICGAVWSIFWAVVLIFKNLKRFKKEFVLQYKNYKKLSWFFICFAVVFGIICILINQTFLVISCVVIILFPFLFIFSKAVEQSCMIVPVFPAKVTEGDWLYQDIVVSGKKIKADWSGVSESELKLIKKKYRKKVWIKQGIPFTPSFLFAILILLFIFLKYGYFFGI